MNRRRFLQRSFAAAPLAFVMGGIPALPACAGRPRRRLAILGWGLAPAWPSS